MQQMFYLGMGILTAIVAVGWLPIVVAPLFGITPMALFSFVSMRRAFLANKEFNVLIVDDDVSSIVLLERALSNFSRLANIDVVERGKDAVKAMASKEYDVVFMDHEMPDLKGPDVVKLADNALAKQMIKNGGEDPQKIQVITYSAKKWEDWDADQLAYISMQGHLMKGESYSSLKGRLSRLIGEPQQGEKALAAI